MTPKLLFSLIISGLAALATDAEAASPKGIAVWGAGKNSCAAYLNEANKVPYLVWTSGYLTGRLYEAKPESVDIVFKNRDIAVYEYFLTDYCREHPAKPFFNATDGLVDRFLEAYMKEHPGSAPPIPQEPTQQPAPAPSTDALRLRYETH